MSFPGLTDQNFAFSPEGRSLMPCESIAKYRPGGLHPVTLGTIICSPTARYRVVQKLGVGGFSTVWLVEILGTLGIAAMRLSSAQFTPPGEDDVLRHIATMEPPPAHFVAILDRFKMEGPNGIHEVIVMEILAPVTAALYWMTGCFRPSSAAPTTESSGLPEATQDRTSAAATRKAIMRSLVEAVSEMHAAGIVHGDLHICNVGLELAGLVSGSDRNRRYIKRTPETTVVLPLDPMLAVYSSHFPPYIVEPWNFSSYLRDLGTDQLTPVVKIFDFGSAYCMERPYPTTGFHDQIIAPEWVIQSREPDLVRTFDAACDVWALGVMIFTIMTGGTYPYDAADGDADFITMARLSGCGVPDSWKRQYEWARDPELDTEVQGEPSKENPPRRCGRNTASL